MARQMISAFCTAVFVLCIPISAQPEDDGFTLFRNSLQVNPFSFISGGLGLGYERMLVPGHGLAAEGQYVFLFGETGYDAGLIYRFYPRLVLESNFFGLFVRTFDTEGKMPYKNKNYDFTLAGYVAGAHYGGHWVHRETGMNLTWRVGYGFPLSEFEWKEPVPADIKDYGSMFELISGLDAELTLGWCF